ncbi:PhoH family protein [Buchananella hordeovulneris]|uniref:PhoH family protein n=1 Tax=Buchananella hordeovulneris TaxID=52770 RepID=UPI000F5E80E9|nr:PhoH family protein [Buchananella hordeovulneris]RRD45044.1 PhoH family protein [Buchananella hordeovulneris]
MNNPANPGAALGAAIPGPAAHAHELPTPPVTRSIEVPSDVDPLALFGTRDEVLRAIEQGFNRLTVFARGTELKFTGPASDVALACDLVGELIELARAGQMLTPEAVARAASLLTTHAKDRPASVLGQDIVSVRGKTIRPKTLGQKQYVDAIDDNTVVFGIGPAGTGKTYLAMAKAVHALQAGQVRRIVLTRPAVEAGENLGYLPGTLTDKIDPYLRPLYDALHEMMDPAQIPKLMAAGTIEVAPLAYMRGRTLNDAFIILDEAQNTTAAQMKMFLTRLGFNSRVVVTGDVSQIDLPGGQKSGLRVVQEILPGIDGIAFCTLTSADVVRHQLVGEIIDAYERYDARQVAADARGRDERWRDQHRGRRER